jgi:4-hydroxy-tetrahydrodipicolinate synthase
MFEGSFVALVTPMDDQGRVDHDALRKLVGFHLDEGTNGLVIAGTTGESAALTTGEYKALVSSVCEQVDGRIPVMAGTGSASTSKTIEMTRLAATLGADAALVVTPYYNRPMQSGLLAHFHAVADATEIPILMYNVPSRTSVDMLAETTAHLSLHGMIAGIKEARPDLQRIADLVRLCPGEFSVMSGDDGSCMKAMLAGANGVVSVAANVVPSLMRGLAVAAVAGDLKSAESIDGDLRELFRLLGIETNPIPVKWAVRQMGLIGNGIRLPLLPLDERHHESLRACLKKLQVN